ncbi:multiple monosaccharide ABC transporter substrate-binding protein [Actinomycetaceae bacterium MB13-C1-2]|nr:multiple monosaccharide ABC transporter substrate-binding protein [Actinomycetaceae bacterium MB13-C1-2]
MKKVMKIAALGAATFALAAGTVGCSADRGGTTAPESEGTTTEESSEGDGSCAYASDALIGVAMPTKSLERWNRDGAHLKELLEADGFKVDLQYADNKVDQQISQIENMINNGAEILVVASIDGEALDPVLTTAADKGIPVIAYDRLIRETEAVDYYATFDNEKVGTLQGEYIVEALDLDNATGPIYLEPFAGSPDDNNAKYFFKGAWDIVSPYIESGVIEVPSGKAPATVDDWQSIGILGWDGSAAQDEMEVRLNSNYRDKKVDVVLSPNDSLALGIAQALEADGYVPGDEYPVLTGQDADQANVVNILAGKQSMTVWKDTRALGDRVAIMVKEIATCGEVEVTDTETYDNGRKVVPSYLLDPVVVTKDNVEELLIGSGFYTEDDLK